MTAPTKLAIALLAAALCGPILALSASDGGREAGAPAPAAVDAALPAASADAAAAAAAARRKLRRRDGGSPFAFPVPFQRRDAGPPVPIPPRLPPSPPPPPPAPSLPSPAPGAVAEAFGDKNLSTCQKTAAGKRVVKLNLKPDSDLGDLIGWISAITCKQFILSSNVAGAGKKITVVAPQLMTRDEAYRAFLNALDTIGLTVVRTGKFLTIIEVSRAKTAPVPVYDFSGRALER